jgi:hypothetical protein
MNKHIAYILSTALVVTLASSQLFAAPVTVKNAAGDPLLSESVNLPAILTLYFADETVLSTPCTVTPSGASAISPSRVAGTVAEYNLTAGTQFSVSCDASVQLSSVTLKEL